MSGPDDISCEEVLQQLYLCLDHEDAGCDEARLFAHLRACEPCLREFGLEKMVKDLVARSCRCEPAPAGLREKVLFRIRTTQVQIVTPTDR